MSTAAVALVGVVVGAVLTGVFNFFSQRAADQRRWAREDRTRHHQERLLAYKNMLAATASERLGFLADDEMIGYWLIDDVLDEAVRTISTCHSEVLLLTSYAKVRQVSAKIEGEVLLLWRKRSYIHGQEPLGDKELGELTGPVLEARSEFLRVAREELNIEPNSGQ